MKVLRTAVVIVILVCSYLFGYSQGTTSQGTEFWTAYMANTNPPSGTAGSQMYLYITSAVNTSGTVTLADGSYSQNFTVTANKITILAMPAQAFFNYQGIANLGIHITSLKPVAIYAHIFAQNSSGATLLLPVSTLGKDYYSINYTQTSDVNPAYSAFMVIATEDSTTVAITPSTVLLDGKPAHVPFMVNLKKGQVYQGLANDDLTGTTVQSVSSGTNTCKKIAFFSGSSRIHIGCNTPGYSSDNLFQQVYPTSSWGKDYITVPLKNRDYDIFRIIFSAPVTNVTINGVTQQFTNKVFYEFDSQKPNYITADQPIQVVQYAVSQGSTLTCVNDSTDIGDPEMIFLSPLEQTIDQVTLYSTSNFLILQSYINVIIKNAFAPTLKLDGSYLPTKDFLKVPTDTAYSYVQIYATNGTHNLVAAGGFNAIAYGFGQYESYGYAAGTNLQDLTQFIALQNPLTDTVLNNGCSGLNYNLKLTLPYKTTSIQWDFKDGSTPLQEKNPVVADSVKQNSQTLYTYYYPKNPVSYKSGDYSVVATVVDPVADPCGSTQQVEFDFTISDPPVAKFTYTGTKLGDTTAFTDETTSSNILKSWVWDFGDGQTSAVENPSHAYLYAGNYNVNLTVTDIDGCTSSYQSTVHIPIAIRNFIGSISTCQGSPSVSPNVEQFTISGIGLTDNITAKAPPGFEVSLTAASGFGNSVTINESAGKIDSAIVYVQSSTSAPAGIDSANVVLVSTGQTSINVPVSGTINPLPTVDPIADQTVPAGATTKAIAVTGSASSFYWANDTPDIGLAASGGGGIPAFTAVNNTSSPITATISVTPTTAGLAYVANSVANTVSVVNTFNGIVQDNIAVGNHPYAVAASPDGSRLYVSNFSDNSISVINTAGYIVLNTIPVGTGPDGIAINAGDSRMYVANEGSNSVSVVDLSTSMVTATITVGTSPIGLSLSPDGSRIYVANLGSNNVSVINTATNLVSNTILVGNAPSSICISNDGKTVYTANNNSNTVSIISTALNKVTSAVAVGLHPDGISIYPDGSVLYVANYGATTVSVINTATNKVMATIQVGTSPFAISISPDGSQLYVTNQGSNSISVIDVSTNMVTSTIALATSPGGIVSTDGTDCNGIPVKFTITVEAKPAQPTITATGSLSALSTAYGTASAADSIIVSGAAMAAGILVTPPPGFEVSTDGVNFSSTVTVGAAGTISPVTVYIRLTATTAVGVYPGNIVLSSVGATNVSVPVANSTVTPVPLSITADNKSKAYGVVNPVLTVTYNGFVNSESAAKLTVLPRVSTTATTTSPVGEYPITASGAVDSNYTFTYIPGILTISPYMIVPNAFTPNGDGINDTWNIKYIENYPNCTVNIYSRYGGKVFSSTGYSVPWDGKYNGANLPTGTYYYIINPGNGRPLISGYVSIIR